MKVHDGTPKHFAENLCASCGCCQHIKGTLINEDVVLCHARGTTPPIRITWKVTKCSEYEDKRTPALWQLEKIAWKVTVDSHRRFVGFLSPKQQKDRGMDSDD